MQGVIGPNVDRRGGGQTAIHDIVVFLSNRFITGLHLDQSGVDIRLKSGLNLLRLASGQESLRFLSPHRGPKLQRSEVCGHARRIRRKMAAELR